MYSPPCALFFTLFITTSVSQREEYDCQLQKGCHVRCDPAYGADPKAEADSSRFPLHCRLQDGGNGEIPIKLFQDNKARLSDLSKKMARLTDDRMMWENLTRRVDFEMKKRNEQIESQEQEISRLNQKITSLETAEDKSRTEIRNLKESLLAQNAKIRSLEIENRELWREVLKLKNDGVEPEKGPCELQDSKHCFWIVIKQAWEVDFKDSESICRNGGGKVALIPNSKIYNGIVSSLRKRMPRSTDNLYVWVAMTYDPLIAIASPSDAFYSWKGGFPANGQTNRLATKIYIKVYELFLEGIKPELDTGMINGAPDWLLNGVVCQRDHS